MSLGSIIDTIIPIVIVGGFFAVLYTGLKEPIDGFGRLIKKFVVWIGEKFGSSIGGGDTMFYEPR